MRRSFAVIVSAVCLSIAVAGAASAGVVDSPVPDMDPSHSERKIFIVPGVTKNNNYETLFNCTNLDSVTVRIGVEVFANVGGPALNDISSGVADGAQDVLPGGAVTIATGNTVAFHEGEVITGLPVNVRGGSARIISTSKRIMCVAFVADELNVPDVLTPGTTAAAMSLPMIAR